MSTDHPAVRLQRTRQLLVWLAAGILATAVACGDAATSVRTPTSEATTATASVPTSSLAPTVTEQPATGAAVRVDATEFPVELAVEPLERVRGLSGRAALGPGTGMLFVFEIDDRFRFWMREMQFPLDIVWIGSECRVVDISENVPHPDPETPLSDLPRYSPSVPARYVLEINAGEAEAQGLGAGDPVEFLDGLAGRFGC